ncbi:MAG: leucine-rich repeat protein [Bacteroidaceae bacterium]|nr:leucine-rich repeat protein [Bacteroidaceae bacterium]
MKARSFLLIGLASLIWLSSCNDEKIVYQSTTVNSIMVKGEDFVDGEVGTRASYLVDGTGFHFSWTLGDTVGIYPVGGDQVAFPISSGDGGQTAQFDGGAWALRSSYSYAAYYPFSSDNYKTKETAIPVSFLGQVQNGNGLLTGMDRYDYQAAVATKPDAGGNVNIALKHLGCFVRFQLTIPVSDTYKSIELKSSKTPFITSGIIDLTSDTISIKPISTSQTISIDLNNTSTTTEDSVLVVYAMFAPIDLSNCQISVIATGSDNKKYASFLSGKNMEAGKAYNYKSSTLYGATITEDGDIVPPDNEIWYKTRSGEKFDLDKNAEYHKKPFNANIVSHTNQDGMWKIVCDAPITIIYEYEFQSAQDIVDFYMPNTIEELRQGALCGLGVSRLYIPQNLNKVWPYALRLETGFGDPDNIEEFYGNHVTPDGKCVIINNALCGFANRGIKTYSIPEGVETIVGLVFNRCKELESITFPSTLKNIEAEAFQECTNLQGDLYFPEALVSIEYRAFAGVKKVTAFYGNDKIVTSDHHCLIYDYSDNVGIAENMRGPWLGKYVGEDNAYTIPEGILGVEHYTFAEATKLESLTIPESMQYFSGLAFVSTWPLEEDYQLKYLYGKGASDDHMGLIENGELMFVVPQCPKDYYVSDNVKTIGYEVFGDNKKVESVTLSDSVTTIRGYAFAFNSNIKRVVLSSNLKNIDSYNPFLSSPNLEEIYFRSYMPPTYSDNQFYESDCSHLTVFVPEETIELYKKSGWSQYAPYMVGYKYDDIGEWNPDYYVSTDMTHDGEVTTLQQSTIGDGINLIFMGDGFSDRQIANGSYDGVIHNAINALFSEEPFRSFSSYFNIYSVNVVSMTEGYDHNGQALGTGHGFGTYVYGNDAKVIEYAKKAISESKMDDALIIVMMNEDAYAGTCFMYDAPDGDYGRGTSIAYFPVNSDLDSFNGLVLHEAGGHGFAKLADEYAYEDNGTIPLEAIYSAKANEQYGWWKNIDFTGSISQVKWSRFINDSRYANENIGCYEGGFTYWSGVWRPTENSIMRYNTGGFNAPSRYAIWYRINKLAYGENWNGTYEDFVAYDAINRTSYGAPSRTVGRRNYVEKPLPALAPPVVVGHSWREAK